MSILDAQKGIPVMATARLQRWALIIIIIIDFFCANIHEEQAQWRDKTNGLSKLMIVRQCMSRQWMEEDARKLRRIGSIKEIGF